MRCHRGRALEHFHFNQTVQTLVANIGYKRILQTDTRISIPIDIEPTSGFIGAYSMQFDELHPLVCYNYLLQTYVSNSSISQCYQPMLTNDRYNCIV